MRKYLFIGIGGVIGAILRYLIKGIRIENYQGSFPFTTLLINVLGCFLLALILTVALEVLEFSPNMRLGIVTGLLGAFTTFSAICKETAALIFESLYFTAAAYAICSLLLGFGAVYCGTAIARRVIIRKANNGRTNSNSDTFEESEE